MSLTTLPLHMVGHTRYISPLPLSFFHFSIYVFSSIPLFSQFLSHSRSPSFPRSSCRKSALPKGAVASGNTLEWRQAATCENSNSADPTQASASVVAVGTMASSASGSDGIKAGVARSMWSATRSTWVSFDIHSCIFSVIVFFVVLYSNFFQYFSITCLPLNFGPYFASKFHFWFFRFSKNFPKYFSKFSPKCLFRKYFPSHCSIFLQFFINLFF